MHTSPHVAGIRQVVLVAGVGDIRKIYKSFSVTLKEISYLEDLGVDGTIILKSISKKVGRKRGYVLSVS